MKSTNDLSIFLKITNLNDQTVSIFLDSLQMSLNKLTLYERQTGRYTLNNVFSSDGELIHSKSQEGVLDVYAYSDLEHVAQLPSANFICLSTSRSLDGGTILNCKEWGYNLQGEVHFIKGKAAETHIEKIYIFGKLSIEFIR